MNVSLTPELDRFVTAKVESGLYTSNSEVVREALRLMRYRDRMRRRRLRGLKDERRVPSDPVRALLRELKAGLALVYGGRLKGVYAYGSYARGEQDAESDLDVLVVLDEVAHYAAEVDRTGELISRLSLSYGVSISRVFVSESAWSAGESGFLLNAREEAVPV